MGKVRVASFGMSIDGYGAGPDQDLANPLGVGGGALHEWAFATRTFHRMLGKDGGSTGVDDEFALRGFAQVGAWIIGRNMFGPIRGPWPDDRWRGWWGDNPPFHVPVFVLTHRSRASIEMQGGTTFHFVTEGVEVALQRAQAAAGGLDVRIGGGPATIRQFLRAGLIDELHLAIAPELLGSGERVFNEGDAAQAGYACTRHDTTPQVMHVVLTRSGAIP